MSKALRENKIDSRLTFLRLRDEVVNDRFGYGYPQLYMYYVYNSSDGHYVDYETFKSIVNEYAAITGEEVKEGFPVALFKGLGKVQARKRRLTAKEALFLLKKTKRLNPTDHSDGYYVMIKWMRRCDVLNNKKYRFIPSKNMASRVHKNIMDGNYNCYETAKK